MKTYSMDLRERVADAYDRGEGGPKRLAARFRVGLAWVYRLLQRRRQTGSIAPGPRGGGHPRAFDEGAAERRRDAAAAAPEATLAESRAAAGAHCSPAAVRRALRRPGLTREESRSVRPSRIAPT
jgi:transposase